MTLSKEDGDLFYKLWIPLLGYAKKKCFNDQGKSTIVLDRDMKEIANKIWDNVSIIDDYLGESTDLCEEHKEILRSWKRCVRGKFMLERHLNKGSIFISLDDQEVYQVCGIVSSWEEMLYFAPMPVLLETTFIPFKDVIISDGLVVPYNVCFGSGVKKEYKDIYLNAKNSGRIHTEL